MSNRELYRFLIKESRCSRQKRYCERKCSNCPLFTPEETSFSYYTELENRIKARDPELYFVNEIEELKKMLELKISNNPEVENDHRKL